MGQSCTDTYASTAASLSTPVACWSLGVGESCFYIKAVVSSQTRTMVDQSTVGVCIGRWGESSLSQRLLCAWMAHLWRMRLPMGC